MSEETKEVTAQHVPSSLVDDQLLAVAAAAEKRVDAINRIKVLSLKVTNSHDWNDQGGKPYMGVSGAEKVARLFGISWRLDEPTREDHEDGHFSYTFKGYFVMGAAEIEVIGTRSSKDPFFGGSKERPIPPSEIDRNDVKKGAMTNCLGNGISRLLGIRNMTWEELEQAGIKRGNVGKVTYRDSDPNAAMKLPNYGRNHCKGKALDDPAVTVEDLTYYLTGCEKSITDPEKAKYKAANTKLRDAIQAELKKREGAAPASPSAPAQTVGASESAATGQGKPHDTAADAPSFPEASWQEFLSYVDDHPDRREVKELVKADYKLKTLKELPAENRAPFVLACQEKAKVNGVKFAIFLTKDGTVPA